MDQTNTQNLGASKEKIPPPQKLTAAEFTTYNYLAEFMDHFVRTPSSPAPTLTPLQHRGFRQQWTLLHTACASSALPAGMTARQFVAAGQRFAAHLTLHHNIEESTLYPRLARRMAAFQASVGLLDQHRAIHAGLDVFLAYVDECERGERALDLAALGAIMDGFGDVLWEHMDEEVAALGADEMRKHWTLAEMDGLMVF